MYFGPSDNLELPMPILLGFEEKKPDREENASMLQRAMDVVDDVAELRNLRVGPGKPFR